MSDFCTVKGDQSLKNDNLDIRFSIGDYHIHILKFSCECQTWSIPQHFHGPNSYEIHYIFNGNGTLICKDKRYKLMEKVLYTTGPYVEHEQIPHTDSPTCEYCIYLHIEEATSATEAQDKEIKINLRHFLDTPFWYGIDRVGLPIVLEQIRHELSVPNIASKIMLKALFLEFFVKILRNYDRDKKQHIEPREIPLVKAYILIEDSFLYEYATITLNRLAERLGLSTRQTSRILFEKYGQTFTEKRTEARMAAASMYLRENIMSTEKIAEKLGYCSVNHFYAAFKKYYHIPLKDYKETIIDSQNQP